MDFSVGFPGAPTKGPAGSRAAECTPAVIPWTVDTGTDLAAALALGVDGVIINYPSM